MKIKKILIISSLFLLTSCTNEKHDFSREYDKVIVTYNEKSDIPANYSKEKSKEINGDLAKECSELFFELINSDLEYKNTELDGRSYNWYYISFYYGDNKNDFFHINKSYPFPITNSSLVKEETCNLNVYQEIDYDFYWKMVKLMEKLDTALIDAPWIEIEW